jgi:hypothetical protein
MSLHHAYMRAVRVLLDGRRILTSTACRVRSRDACNIMVLAVTTVLFRWSVVPPAPIRCTPPASAHPMLNKYDARMKAPSMSLNKLNEGQGRALYHWYMIGHTAAEADVRTL